MHVLRHSVPASAVVVLLEALDMIDGDYEAALRSAQLAHTSYELRAGNVKDVSRYSFARFAQECVLQFEQHGCRRDARPNLPVERLKLLCLTMLACPTLDIAIGSAIEFHRMAMGERSMLSLTVEGDQAVLVMDIPLRERKVGDLLVTMYGLAMFYRLFGWLTGEEIRLSHVTLAYPAKLEVPAFNELLQLQPRFGALNDSIAFPASFLRRPIIRDYADLERLFKLFPFDLLPPDYGTGLLSDHIRAIMKAAFSRRENLPRLPQVSRMFGLTPATLRRRLAGEGTSLIKLRESCRRDVAMDLLVGSSYSIKEIASRVQFNDSATFRRAFRQWTGQSPSQYRQTAGAQTPAPYLIRNGVDFADNKAEN